MHLSAQEFVHNSAFPGLAHASAQVFPIVHKHVSKLETLAHPKLKCCAPKTKMLCNLFVSRVMLLSAHTIIIIQKSAITPPSEDIAFYNPSSLVHYELCESGL